MLLTPNKLEALLYLKLLFFLFRALEAVFCLEFLEPILSENKSKKMIFVIIFIFQLGMQNIKPVRRWKETLSPPRIIQILFIYW